MASIKDRLQGILNKATVNNTNLGLVLNIIIRKKNEHDEQITNLNEEKLLLETEIVRLKDTNKTESENYKTESENLENDKNKKEEEIALLKEEINKLNLSLQTLENDSVRNQTENLENLENIQKITAELQSKKEELENLKKICNENKLESDQAQKTFNDLNKNKIEELENNLNTANQNLTIEKAKTEGLDDVIRSIENELGKTNEQLQTTTTNPLNLEVQLDAYPATTGGKSLKMKKHHKKHLKRKTRKIRNKKHKSK